MSDDEIDSWIAVVLGCFLIFACLVGILTIGTYAVHFIMKFW